jgi:hypothetical protein
MLPKKLCASCFELRGTLTLNSSEMVEGGKLVAFRLAPNNSLAVRLMVILPAVLLVGITVGFSIFSRPGIVSKTKTTALPQKKLPTNRAASPDSPATADAKAQRLMAALSWKGTPMERDNELYLAIEAFTAEDFQRLVADPGVLKSMTEKLGKIDWQTGKNLASALIGRWLKVEPSMVMTWAPRLLELIPAKEKVRGFILDALAAKRPAEMLALVPSRKNATERAEIISRALLELAASDPTKARAWLRDCTDAADRRVAEKAMRWGTVKADPLRSIELAGSIEDRAEAWNLLKSAAASAAKMGEGVSQQLATSPMKPWLLSAVFTEFAERDPELAVDLAVQAGTGGGNEDHGIQEAFAALAGRDPQKAITKLEVLKGQERAAAVSAIGQGWAAREPAAALGWLAEQPASDRIDQRVLSYNSHDALLISFAAWADDDPQAARAWAEALPDGETRDAVGVHLAFFLASRGEGADAAKVLARLGSAPDPKALADIASRWAFSDPQAAADWAITQNPGPAQSRAIASIVGTWADEDAQAVEKWLTQFPPGEARDRSIAAFLSHSSANTVGREKRMAELDRWFDLMKDSWQRAQIAQEIFSQKKQIDPAAARAWLAALPNVDPEVIRMTLRDSNR